MLGANVSHRPSRKGRPHSSMAPNKQCLPTAEKAMRTYRIRMRLALLAILLGVVTTSAEATGQIPDRILINGKSEMLFTEPLKGAFRADPQTWRKLMARISNKSCSASWRGYVASWEIRKKELYLVSVTVDPCSSRKSVPLANLFPGATRFVKATWFTGSIKIPQGKQIEYVHMGYESRYEHYLLLEINKGNVTSSTLTSGMRTPVLPPSSDE